MLSFKDYIVLNVGKRIIKLVVLDILYVICEDYICFLTMEDGRTINLTRSLQSVHGQLESSGFRYVNRDVVVNMRHVTELQRTSARKWRVLMSDGHSFDIAARRQKEFKKSFFNDTLANKNSTLTNKSDIVDKE